MLLEPLATGRSVLHRCAACPRHRHPPAVSGTRGKPGGGHAARLGRRAPNPAPRPLRCGSLPRSASAAAERRPRWARAPDARLLLGYVHGVTPHVPPCHTHCFASSSHPTSGSLCSLPIFHARICSERGASTGWRWPRELRSHPAGDRRFPRPTIRMRGVGNAGSAWSVPPTGQTRGSLRSLPKTLSPPFKEMRIGLDPATLCALRPLAPLLKSCQKPARARAAARGTPPPRGHLTSGVFTSSLPLNDIRLDLEFYIGVTGKTCDVGIIATPMFSCG